MIALGGLILIAGFSFGQDFEPEEASMPQLMQRESALHGLIGKEHDPARREELLDELDEIADEMHERDGLPLSDADGEGPTRRQPIDPETVSEALRKDPASLSANRLAARNALAIGKFKDAERFATTGLARRPGDPRLLRTRALARYGSGDRDGARADARAAAKAAPDDPKGVALSHLLESKGFSRLPAISADRFARPAQSGDTVSSGSPGNAASSREVVGSRAARVNVRVSGRTSGPAPLAGTADAIREGERALRLGDPSTALRRAQGAVAAEPTNRTALHLKAQAEEALDKNGEAIDDESDVMMDSPAVGALLIRTLARIREREADAARRDAATTRRLDRGGRILGARVWKALELFFIEPPADAGAPVRQVQAAAVLALSVIPDTPQKFESISPISLRLTREALGRARVGDLSEAARLVNLAIRKDERNAWAYALRAAIHLAEGRTRRAVEDSAKALEMEPIIAEALVVRSKAFRNLSRLDEAERDASAAIHLQPRSVAALRLRAEVREAKGDRAGADADRERIRRLDGPGRGRETGLGWPLWMGVAGALVSLGALFKRLRW